MIKHTYQEYNNREERNKFIANKLKKYLGNSVLNVGGGGEKHLQKYLPTTTKYTEIDIDGKPDIMCNLEKDLPLKILDNAFETVIASDVLEHLENPIDVLEEMIRVSNKYIVLSLPNNWCTLKFEFLKNNGQSGKFYGFPIYKPNDRHKWFFNAIEAEMFFKEVSKKYSLEIVELFHIGYFHKNYFKNFSRLLVSVLFGNNVRKNLFSTAIWCVLEKKDK